LTFHICKRVVGGAFLDGAALTAIPSPLHTSYIAHLTPTSCRANPRRRLIRRSGRLAEPGVRPQPGLLSSGAGRRGPPLVVGCDAGHLVLPRLMPTAGSISWVSVRARAPARR
jgi:hypothetical protein